MVIPALDEAQLESSHKKTLDKPKFRDILLIILRKLPRKSS